jgi:hypothetical protein
MLGARMMSRGERAAARRAGEIVFRKNRSLGSGGPAKNGVWNRTQKQPLRSGKPLQQYSERRQDLLQPRGLLHPFQNFHIHPQVFLIKAKKN